jgi:hypothetical protein
MRVVHEAIEERVEDLGERIAEEEFDLLLAWAVDGAARLIKNRGFTMPESRPPRFGPDAEEVRHYRTIMPPRWGTASLPLREESHRL